MTSNLSRFSCFSVGAACLLLAWATPTRAQVTEQAPAPVFHYTTFGGDADGPDCEARIGAPSAGDDLLDAVDLDRFAGLADTGLGPAYGREGLPGLVADFFGQAVLQVSVTNTVEFSFPTRGFIVSGGSGDPNAVLVFEANGGTADDFFTTGVGQDLSMDGFADRFNMTEPLPPNEVPTSPGSEFTYAGGTVTYTNDPAATTPANGAFVDSQFWFANYRYTDSVELIVPVGGLGVRRVKLAENNSPIPRDRLLFNYNFFNDVRSGFGDVNRYTLGFEKTFLQGMASAEVRAPFAMTLDSDQRAGAGVARNVEFGNLSVFLKVLLAETETCLWSAGLGVSSPAADNSRVFLANGTPVLRVENDAAHLMPFIAGLLTPNDKFFAQGFVQLDIDANGNPTFGSATGGHLTSIGRLQSAAMLFVDVGIGWWHYTNPNGRLSGIAPGIELHYSGTLEDPDTVSGNGLDLRFADHRTDSLNLTLTTHFFFGNRLEITPAMVIPIRDGSDRRFDFEAIVQANYGY